MARTLYLTRNGLLEPLGQSQVFAYLKGLARDYQITLITYEKAEDWEDKAQMAHARADCEEHGIVWLPQKFRSGPTVVAPVWNLIQMIWLLWREVRRGAISLVHARSYIPAGAALVVHRLCGTPFIFDMRALWPEELITAGRISRGSLVHKTLVWLERKCLEHAQATVSLTHAAVNYLHATYPRELADKKITVIPTCADLERFKPRSGRSEGPFVYGCIGTVLSGWFRADWLARWIAQVSEAQPDALFDIVTRDDAEKVRGILDPRGDLSDRLTIGPCDSRDMPVVVCRHDVSIMFFTDGLGKLGSSPTRMGEVLGCGLPVIANKGVGDVATIVEQYQVGVLLDGPEPTAIDKSLAELGDLMLDTGIASRCRETAERVFSLETGTRSYREIYARIAPERSV